MAFNVSVALASSKTKEHQELSICDLGGGIGLFSVGCATYGFKRTVLVDDFEDSVNHDLGDSILSVHKKCGIEIFSRDVIKKGIKDIEGNFDIITSFDSMEHWHDSPKKLFAEVAEKLNPSGVFVLGVPNCVNMRKRITVPFGHGKWSSIDEWYEIETFRGHVREPDVDDLKYIARDMNLKNIKILGRNWQGYYSQNSTIKLASKIMDYSLRLRPQLCSDIYLVGVKA
ncbi:MAG TPA: methyltransferase domain-containing protein [Flavobacteriales bacterium]|nr:methyltransferase domain-containing protein [Flavobacteriales bacterium]